MRARRNRWIAPALLAIGLLQMIGDVVGSKTLRGIGAASLASPAPRVFSSAGGLETFSSRFFVEFEDADGRQRSVEITPASYSHLRGPYQRRNAYGAALAYGPILLSDPKTRPLAQSVIDHALCGEAPVLREIGIERSTRALRVRLVPRPGTDGHLSTLLEPRCG